MRSVLVVVAMLLVACGPKPSTVEIVGLIATILFSIGTIHKALVLICYDLNLKMPKFEPIRIDRVIWTSKRYKDKDR